MIKETQKCFSCHARKKEMDADSLKALYKRYRFEEIKTRDANVFAFEHKSGYFQNVDIVSISNESNALAVKQSLDETGYSTIIRNFGTLQEAEKSLFDGFFEITTTKGRIKQSYSEYVDKLSKIIGGPYKYIPSKFDSYPEEIKDSKQITKIVLEELNLDGPVLIIIEAAAGFGKTCTSYELIQAINDQCQSKIPLFAELSRNRQAQIFKYVLLDEINREFYGIGLELVQHHIKRGDIPLLVDGFDELIRGKSENEKGFEDTEPMLETIRELLHDNAKIILTSRKTAIFAGDEFQEWINRVNGQFKVIRFGIHPPTVTDWLGPTRIKSIEKAGIDPENVANPVLLSFLSSAKDSDYESLCAEPDKIVNKYFESLLERERERQQLLMSVDQQMKIFQGIAKEMVCKRITSELRDFFEKYIIKHFESELANASLQYLGADRPTIDQLGKKLVMHALLDRKGNGEGQIGFVNDFIFGSFIGQNIIEDGKEDWLADEQYAEMALLSYRPRSVQTKKLLWEKIKYMTEFLEVEKMLNADIWLLGKISRDLSNYAINEYEFKKMSFGVDQSLQNVVFSKSNFTNCSFDFLKINNSLFIGCKFYNCSASNINQDLDKIFVHCEFVQSPSLNAIYAEPAVVVTFKKDASPSYKKAILERFWPPGRAHFSIKRKVRTLFLGMPAEDRRALEAALEELRKEGIVSIEGDSSMLNLSELTSIHSILGR